jgi:tRNA(fMet)-specific endonuclease VapC
VTRYLLDTNICIYVIRQKPQAVLTRLQGVRLADVAISAITLSELQYGVSKSARPEQNRVALAQFVAPIEVLDYDGCAATRYGDLRAELERAGEPLGSLDMLIAAHALALDRTLVTNNEAEFRRVPALSVENWAA